MSNILLTFDSLHRGAVELRESFKQILRGPASNEEGSQINLASVSGILVCLQFVWCSVFGLRSWPGITRSVQKLN